MCELKTTLRVRLTHWHEGDVIKVSRRVAVGTTDSEREMSDMI